MRRLLRWLIILGLGIPGNGRSLWGDRHLESENLSTYVPVSGITGNLNSIGSDTLNNMMTLWAESFQAIYPNVNIQLEGKGSSTAPPALIESTAQLGPMSRDMKPSEIQGFEVRFGYEPMRIPVAMDALAIFLHKNNPIEVLNLKQLDAIFSQTRYRGNAAIISWSQLGLEGPMAKRTISVFGRNSASGTHGLFKKYVLLEGDFLPKVQEQQGSSAVVMGVANDLYSIGYSGIGYQNSGVKIIKISDDGETFFSPAYQHVVSGEYPLSRVLWIYINRPPGEPMDALVREFLKFVLSREGQAIVEKSGYYPVPQELAERYMDLLN